MPLLNRFMLGIVLLTVFVSLLRPGFAASDPIPIEPPAPADAAFRQGNAFFQQSRYEHAADAYLRALRAGFRSPLLFHNLGVVFYKSQRYVEARAAFEKALDDPALVQRCRLNLALIAVKQQDYERAKKQIDRIDPQNGDETITTLAKTLRERIDEEIAQQQQAPLSLFVFGSAGAENNSVSEQQDSVLQEKNVFSDLSGYAAYRLLGHSSAYLDGYASLYSLWNDTSHDTDLNISAAGLEWGGTQYAWSKRLNGAVTHLRLHGQDYQNIGELTPWLRWRWRPQHALTLQYVFQYQRALAEEFAATSGQLHRLNMSYQYGSYYRGSQLLVEHEMNERANVTDGVANYNPQRTRLRLEFRRPVLGGAGLWRMEYRNSADVLADGSRREDRRTAVLLQWDHPLVKQFEIGWEYEYVNQDSTDTVYAYDRHRLGLVWTWIYGD